MPLFDQLYNFAHWLAQDRTEAEDLVQETYVKALKGFSSFQPGTNFRAWIYRILRNTFLTSRTGLKATVALDADDGPELPAGPHQREFQIACTTCHSTRLVLTQPPFPKAKWEATVKKMAEAYGVHGEGPISDPKDLSAAFKRGIEIVKKGEPAMIDVITQPR